MNKIQEFEIFQLHFGFEMPSRLAELFKMKLRSSNKPSEYHFDKIPPKLEIEYWLDPREAKNFDTENMQLTFAVNSDGHVLLVDLNDECLPILQKEFGEIDSIGLKIQDLLSYDRLRTQ